MKRLYTDRSRILEFQRCPRRRYLAYTQNGTGIRSKRMPLPLAVGLSVHVGLESLLIAARDSGQEALTRGMEDIAVAVALADFAQYTSPDAGLELDATERQALTLVIEPGMNTPEVAQMVGAAQSGFDAYLAQEQTALVEAMVRAYARRRLRPLLEQYEILEVEREGSWQLSSWPEDEWGAEGGAELWFMSRPDALLLERASGQLYLQSYKTTSSWDVRKARDAEHDMQGLSEGVEVERRLAEWHTAIKLGQPVQIGENNPLYKLLASSAAPPRILGIRYEYLLKGDRWRDKDLAQRFQLDARSQRSHLVRGYLNQGMVAGDEQWNWSWDYHKDDGSVSKLYYKSWRSEPVWGHMPIARWIDMLDSAAMAQVGDADAAGQDVRELGYKCDAQATGFTAGHPLDECFVPPVLVYRNDDDLRDMVEQVEAQERRAAEDAERIAQAADDGERRRLLNVCFPMHRHSCEYPSTCAFVPVCFGGEEIRRDPMSSGRYRARVPNHPQERDAGGEDGRR